MSEHTKGPWRVKDNGSMEGPHVYGPVHPVDGGDYAPLAGYNGGALSHADAHLISAAPELLAIAKRLLPHLIQSDNDAFYPWHKDYIAQLEAAIAKAEGESC